MPRLMPPAQEMAPRVMAVNDMALLEAGAGGAGFLAGVDPSVLAFFLGGITVLLVLLIYEVYLYVTYYRRRRSRA